MKTGTPFRVEWVVVAALFVAVATTGCVPGAGVSSLAAHPSDPPRPQTSPLTVQPPEVRPDPPDANIAAASKPDKAATVTPNRSPDARAHPGGVSVSEDAPASLPLPVLHQLTTGGCCTQPFWSSDSRRVLFIDKPASDAPAGIWGVDIDQPKSGPELVTDRIGFYTSDFEFLVDVTEDATFLERLSDKKRWAVPAGGEPVYLSPGRQRIAWQVSNDAPFERRVTQVWVADLDGSNARSVGVIPRGGFAGWISDDVLLLSGREALTSPEHLLYTLSLDDGSTVELVRSERLRGALLSPDGQWLAYFLAFEGQTGQNGLWVVRTDGLKRRHLDREVFGAYQWRDVRRLLIVPFKPEAAFHEFWEVEVETGDARRLTNPAVTPFKIANGDWRVSPDGRHVAYVESQDHNIWVITLPPGGVGP